MKDTPLAGEDDCSPDLAAIPSDAICTRSPSASKRRCNVRCIARLSSTTNTVSTEFFLCVCKSAQSHAALANSTAIAMGPRSPNIVIPTALRKLPANRLRNLASADVIVAFAKRQNLVNSAEELTASAV